ncbi:hypothetical protein GCM10027176_50370 [Actinoallomurus bryophytorum]|uniref:WD40 repeat protein n=1 Tax=Actinoallomurus bryophytorum TaxID=1490222 RepID=A0A543CI58_9ACTN|nr:helix-turn-helix domain-containing protein [Actinoallomurus bryophytorum]TQL96710.1 WD40 repeat protein [Actinoallomurus bryophytorum]
MPVSDHDHVGEPGPDPELIATSKDFSHALVRLRRRAGLSIRDVARDLRQRPAGQVSVATLGGWFGGRHLPTPKLDPVLFELLALCGVTSPEETRQWRAALDRVRSMPGRRPRSSPSPFRGLAAYEPEDAESFCGREALTGELLELAGRSRRLGRPMIVVGPSGSGKSSLLRAGLIPALGRPDSPLYGTWAHVSLTPGERPVRELARRLADLLGRAPDALDQELMEHPAWCGDLIRSGAWDGDGVLIVADQFEELFTSCKDDGERAAFIEALCSAAAAPPAVVAFGMRADFYLQALRVPRLVPILQDSQLVVGAMSETELRQAITEPARRYRITVEPALVEVLLHDLSPSYTGAMSEAGALPLLSHALLATWDQATGRTLTLDHYRATGGIRDAVTRTAENAFAELSVAGQKDIARRLFLSLVRTGHDAADTRRRVSRAELLAACDAEPAAVLEVLDRFVNSRLITVDGDSIEITHEALLTTWPRLTGWLDADRTWRRLHHGLTVAAHNWQRSGYDPDGLYRGGMLQVVRENAESRAHRGRLSLLERDFLDASVARDTAETRAVRRRLQRRHQLSALLTVLALLAVGVTVYARQLRASGQRDRALALSRTVADEADRLLGKDVPLAAQLALAAYRISPTPEARSSLLNSTAVPAAWRLGAPSGPVRSMAVSGDGRLLAGRTDPGAVWLWRIGGDGRAVLAGMLPAEPDSSVALSYDGRTLAATDGDRVRLWSTADPYHPVRTGTLSGPDQPVASLTISASGRDLAAAAGRTVYLWDLDARARTTSTAELSGPRQAVRAVAFTPGGRTLAAGSNDATVRLWRISGSGRATPAGTLRGPASQVFSIAISPDGRRLAAGTGAEHRVYLWNIGDPAHPSADGPALTGPASWINTVTFGPDGTTLAAGSSDNLLWVYDLRTRRSTEQLPHPNPVMGASYPSAGSLVTLGDDGTIRGWSLPGPIITGARDSVFALDFDGDGHKLAVGPGAGDNTLTVWNPADLQHPVRIGRPLVNSPHAGTFSGSGALTPDGRTFAVGDVDGSVQLWNIHDPGRPGRIGAPIRAASELIESVTISDDGHLLAASSDDGAVHLIDITRPDRPVALGELRPPDPGTVYQAAFSHDGTLIGAASGSHRAYLWDIRRPAAPKPLSVVGGFATEAYSVALSHDGRILAVSGADGTVRLWDIADPRHPDSLGPPLLGPVGYVYSVAFSPQQNVLAAGSTDDTVWLWDLTRPRDPAPLATLTGPAKGVLAVAFSPDGHTLAAGGHDRTVRLWETAPETAAARVCATTGQPITRQEWHRYVPGRAYEPPCP